MKTALPDSGLKPEALRHLLADARRGIAWRTLLKPGDWLTLLLGLALVGISYPLLWRGGVADRAIIKRDGAIVTELGLHEARKITVSGAIGDTVIEVQPGRARVLADPGPRQYCVQQGWLTRAGAVAICAPSHITLQLGGGDANYDSLNY